MAELAETSGSRGNIIQCLDIFVYLAEDIAVSDEVAATSAAPAGSTVVRIAPLDAAIYVKGGYMTGEDEDEPPVVNYTTDIGMYIPVGVVAHFGVKDGMVVSMITADNTETGTVNVAFM